MTPNSADRHACGCRGLFARAPVLPRRRLLAMAAGAVAAPFLVGRAAAADGTAFDAMLLTCIDPRLVVPVNDWMASQGLKGQFSQFAIAGAAVGVVAPAFAAWHPAFWDNLAASIQLHKIKRVIVVNHRDCGAAAIAYGADSIGTPAAESNLHKTVFAQFRSQLATRQPSLRSEGGLMALNGTIDMFG